MRVRSRAFVGAMLSCASWAGAAATPEAPFTGSFAGLEAGLLEHHFGFVVTANDVVVRDDYQRSWGAGGRLFAGHDFALSPRLRLGLEAALVAGGQTNRATIPQNRTDFSLSPRWGYRLTGRGGLLVGSNWLAYLTGGFGGHRYRVRSNSTGVENPPVRGDSFIIGGGVEYRASHRVGVRLDFKHLDNQTNQLFIGIPVKF